MEKNTLITKTKTTGSLSELCPPICDDVRCCVDMNITVMFFQMRTLPVRKIDEKMEEMFHGTKDKMSHIDMVVKGLNDCSKNQSMSYLMKFCCNRSMFISDNNYTVGRHVKKSALENKSLPA
jgi:glycerol-3-phosphate responsive antiterminator